MSLFIKLIQAFSLRIPSQENLDQAYLAESVNIHDLERRMREIDLRTRHGHHAGVTISHSVP